MSNLINYGDEIIIWGGYQDPLKPLIVTRGVEYATREGFWPHDRFVGKEYGSRIAGRHRYNKDIGVIPPPLLTILKLTPELWSQALPHRTQIIVQTDISVIIAKLGLKPGRTIAEAGTGSGSLTHSLARAVAPTGKVFTFDFHQVRAQQARVEFARHGLSEVVVSGWRDVCSKILDFDDQKHKHVTLDEQTEPLPGYGLIGGGAKSGEEVQDHTGHIDAVFLDVPCPWDAVPHVLKILKSGTGKICSYSPCIEQTQKFCDALRKSDHFYDIHTVEALSHEHVPTFYTKKEKAVGVRRLREMIDEVKQEANGLLSTSSTAEEIKESGEPSIPNNTANQSNKKSNDNNEENGAGDEEAGNENANNDNNNNTGAVGNNFGSFIKGFSPHTFGRGHTAYLTFATRRQKAEEMTLINDDEAQH